jgi:hypothetical protein
MNASQQASLALRWMTFLLVVVAGLFYVKCPAIRQVVRADRPMSHPS